eukprot:TRINITY_DN4594_c0_g2_i1.p1 TRINITY_DN4594_c0_g2~~TRINITY_DN4594_c0_g2_i1.p1  ORF type:complete len:1018 (-),score=179.46 TRINITY_DN4594_c0_g2_i1:199-3252(-)
MPRMQCHTWVAVTFFVGVAGTDDMFRRWLSQFGFAAPSLNVSTPFWPSASSIVFDAGNCTDLTIGGVRIKDSSNGPNLDFTLNVTDTGVRCLLQSRTASLTAEMGLKGISLAASAKITPFVGQGVHLPIGIALPMGIAVSGCRLNVPEVMLQFHALPSVVASLEANKSLVADALRASMRNLLCGSIAELITERGATVLKTIAQSLVDFMQVPPTPALPPVLEPVVDWGSYPPLLLGKAMLAERLKSWGDAYRFEGLQIPVTGDFGIHVGMVEIAGLHSLQISGISLGGGNGTINASVAGQHLSVSVASQLQVTSSPLVPDLQQNLNLSIDFTNFSLSAQVLAMLSRRMFESLSVEELQSPGCLIACAKNATDPYYNSLGMRELHIGLDGLGLGLAAPTGLAADLANAFDSLVSALLGGYLQTLIRTANGMGAGFLLTLPQMIWPLLNHLAEDHPCEELASHDFVVGEPVQLALQVASISLAFVGLVAGLTAEVIRRCKRQSPRSPGTGTQDAACHEHDAESNSPMPTSSVNQTAATDGLCLAMSGVPCGLAIVYPFAVLAVLCLFLYADLSLGTSVDLEIEAGEHRMTFGSLFSFSLIGTIGGTWNAGAYAISLLTLLFSGIWPIMKLFFLLGAWLLPSRLLSVSTRGRMLGMLDACGKYSFLDSWFLVLCMSAFSMKWEGGGASLSVLTNARPAYYMFLLATMLSLALGNIASWYHHAAKPRPSAAKLPGQPQSRRVSLGSYWRSRGAQAAVTISLFLCIVAVVVGTLVSSFQLNMAGLGAKVLFQEEKHEISYSLVSAGASLTSSMAGDAGLMALETVFLLLSAVVPVCLLVALLLLWLLPLTASEQDGLLYACHVMDAWSTLEVFVITVIVAHAEFTRLAARLVATGSLAPACNLARDKFGASCMDLGLELEPGFVALLVSGIVALLVPRAVQHVAQSAVEVRNQPASVKAVDAEKDAGEPARPTLELDAADGSMTNRTGGASCRVSVQMPSFGVDSFVPRASGNGGHMQSVVP